MADFKGRESKGRAFLEYLAILVVFRLPAQPWPSAGSSLGSS
jgi:hypothetical protein